MMYLFLGVLGAVLSFGSLTFAQANKTINKSFNKSISKSDNNKALTIGSYRIIETTRLYPKPNYYDQMLDCSLNATPNPFQGISQMSPLTPPASKENLSPIIIDPNSTIGTGNGTIITDPTNNGIVNDIGNGSGAGTGNGTGTGVINFDPVTGGNGGLGPSAGQGTIFMPPPSYGNDFTNPQGISLDKIVNIGNVIWSIVEMGRPNVRVQSYRAHALPKGIVCWTDLENWQIPVSKVFSIEYKNKLGQVVVVYSYRISYVFGGNVDGVGKYLANLTVTPVDMRVSWGFNFSSQVQIPATFNVGSKRNPTAGMQVFVFWSIGNALKVEQKSALFFIAGDGRIQLTESK